MNAERHSRSSDTFRLVAYDEGGVRGTPTRRRLVCSIEGGGKVAIWGREGARENIDTVQAAGLPCTIECEYRSPSPSMAQRFGHTHWVPGDVHLRIVEDRNRTAVELNPDFVRALDLIEASEQNLFITGKAGTGKSTLLDYFRANSRRSPVVLAPTGVAALNVRGETVHRFFGFGIDITPEKVREKRGNPRNPELYKKLATIVIDEVSMLRADLLDCVDTFLRKHGPRRNAPFGGVQMVFVGDLYQLPPVVTSDVQEIFRSVYETPYFFSARALAGEALRIVELAKVYRQKNTAFINLLNRIRDGSVDADDLARLNERVDRKFEPINDRFYISLTTTNGNADRINTTRLASLPGKRMEFHAHVEGDFGREYYPTATVLAFKEGAQIMMVNNDIEGRWVNGSIGTIESVEQSEGEEDSLLVRLQDKDELVEVSRHTWELVRFALKGARIVTEPAGRFRQMPFRLAWAVTIHKSQGKTFDHIVVDLERGAFASGQTYVALSRCTSFEGIVLRRPIDTWSIKVDPQIRQFLNDDRSREPKEAIPVDAGVSSVNAEKSAKPSGTFRVVAYDEGGVRGATDRQRLVCNIEGGGKVVFWGRDGSRQNVDAVLKAGIPCTVECEYSSPKQFMAERFGHTHWVSQEDLVRILKDGIARGS